MPRDIDQYRVCYTASLDGPSDEEYRVRLRDGLFKEDGGTYSESMIIGIASNVIGTGFVRKESDVVLPPACVWRRWPDAEWDLSEAGFCKYVHETLLKWGREFPDGLVVAYDILTQLGDVDLPASEILAELTREKYDGRDRYASRTLREILKLLEFASWVRRDGSMYSATKRGARSRSELRKRDIYTVVEKILTKVDPVLTGIFTVDEKILLSKLYMYRESGGKYKGSIVQRAHDIIFRYPYHWKLKSEIEDALQKEEIAKKSLKEEIATLDAGFGEDVRNLRNRSKLEAIRGLLASDDKGQAYELIRESTGYFSWQSLRSLKHSGPDYSIKPGIVPYEWQTKALSSWKKAGRRGLLQVVTGAGKTVFALFAVADLLTQRPALRVSVVVPTKVLMYQWASELVRILGVPVDDIGFRGDGHKDSFADGKKVMLSIINSAVIDDYLVNDVDQLDSGVRHLLIADECHRYRGERFSDVFKVRTDWTLGLSATPTDPDRRNGSAAEDKDVLLDALGSVFYEYSYKEALGDAVIQPFIVKYVGVELTEPERQVYNAYTKRIGKSLKKIRQRYGPRLGAMHGPFYAKLNTILNGDERPDPSIRRYFSDVRSRKDIVFQARNRKWAYLDIIYRHTVDRVREDREDKIIVFHERIDNLEEIIAPTDYRRSYDEDDESSLPIDPNEGSGGESILAKYQNDPLEKAVDQSLEKLFARPSFRPVMYHSGHSSPAWNEIGMEWFRAGIANVMLSVKALVEGVDVPAANVGIIRASSSSVRQRIQTTGRILRRAAGKDQPAELYVLYVRDTTDERIFRGTDWTEELGSSAVESHHWYAPSDPSGVHGRWEDRGGELPEVPAFEDVEDEVDVDLDGIDPGDAYPGRYAGVEYHVDASGRPFKKSKSGRKFIANPEIRRAAKLVFSLKRGGKFVITPSDHLVTKNDDRQLVFLGVLESELAFEEPDESQTRRRFDKQAPTFDELFGPE